MALLITFERQSMYYITSCFLPTFVLGILAYFTFFIDIADFNDRFMGSLTALLVLASMMSVFTSDLPNTSYTKVIDMWLLFFIISTAVNISVHIIVDFLWKREQHALELDGIGKLFSEKENTNGSQRSVRSKKVKVKKGGLSAQMVNKLFVVGFPIAFVLFICTIGLYIATQPG